MKAIKRMLVAVMLVVLTAGFAGNVIAEDTYVRVNNTNNNTAASNASAKQKQQQEQAQKQQQFLQNSYVSPIQPYNPNAPAAMLSGPELQLGEWGLFTTTLFDSVTFEQAVSLSDGYPSTSFWSRNRLGMEAIMTRNLEPTTSIEITKYWGRMPGDEFVASFPIFGKRGDQLEGLIGLAMKRAMELGATKVGILIRTVKEINTNGYSLGVGAGAGLYIPCNSGVGTGLNFGVYKSKTKTDDMYELNVVALKGGTYVPPPAPVVKEEPKPAPAPKVCDPTDTLKKIDDLKREVKDCKKYCFNNLQLRHQLVLQCIEAYVCTGNKDYLREAEYHAGVAERNYCKGIDINAHRAEAKQLIDDVHYHQAGVINQLRGKDVADKFADAKGLETYPKRFAQ